MEREDFIEIKENFGTFIPVVFWRCRGAKFIVEESPSEQNPPPVVGVSARAKGKRPEENISQIFHLTNGWLQANPSFLQHLKTLGRTLTIL